MRFRNALPWLPSLLCALVALAAAAWLVVLIVSRQPVHIHWSIQVTLAISAILVSLIAEQHRTRQWVHPFGRLLHLLSLVRQGQAPIEELSKVRGAMTPLVVAIQEALRELKQQRSEMTTLNEELRQRVAQRTDALERKVGSLRQQATRDGLTGLYNRRMLDEHLPRVLDRCRAEARNLALLMTDIDHFKAMNDTLGHAAGDELLKAFGQIARSTIGDEDLAFRCGGDEFVILLVGCDLQRSQEIMERLISLTDGYAQTLRVQPSPRLSVGMSLLSEMPQATADQLLQSADKTLYDMKFARKQDRMSPAETASNRKSA